MTTLKTTLHLYAALYPWNTEWTLTTFHNDSMASTSDAETQYVYLKPLEIEAEMPEEREIMTALVQSLRERQDAILAEARLAHTKIEERIQSLLSLPHHG